MTPFTLRPLISGNIVDAYPNAVSSHCLCTISGIMHRSRQKSRIRNPTFPFHLCHRDLLHFLWWSKAVYSGYTLLCCKSMPLTISLGGKKGRIHLTLISTLQTTFILWPRGFAPAVQGSNQVTGPRTGQAQILCLRIVQTSERSFT